MLQLLRTQPIHTALSPYGGGMGDVFMVLLITVAVFVLAWLAARFLARRSIQPRRHGLMQIVDRQALGKDRQVVLMKVGTEHYLIGVSQNSIQFSNPVNPGDFSTVLAEKEQQAATTQTDPDNTKTTTIGQRLDQLIAFMKNNGRPNNTSR